MSTIIENEECLNKNQCFPNQSLIQNFEQANINNNYNRDSANTSMHTKESYPGMVNRVCNIFGMKPEEYNKKLITETYYSNIIKKRRNNQTDYNNIESNNQPCFCSEKKRKCW